MFEQCQDCVAVGIGGIIGVVIRGIIRIHGRIIGIIRGIIGVNKVEI